MSPSQKFRDPQAQSPDYGEAFHALFQKSHQLVHACVASVVDEWVALLASKEQELEEASFIRQRESNAQLERREALLQKWEKDLRQRETALESQLVASRVTAEATKDKICLNVGGTRYVTSKETLLRESDTFFHAMLHSGAWEPDESGEFFIDRDPQYFGVVLNYLRDGELQGDFNSMSSEEQELIVTELDFYQLTQALQALGRHTTPPSGLITFDEERCTKSIVVSKDRSNAVYSPASAKDWACVHVDVPQGDCSFSFTSESHQFIVVSHNFASLEFPLWPQSLHCFLAGYGTHWSPHTIVPRQSIYTVTIKSGQLWLSGTDVPLPMHAADLLFFFKQKPTSVHILPDLLKPKSKGRTAGSRCSLTPR